MRVLWITNTIFPLPSKALGLPVPVVGGWMYGLAGQLVACSEIKMAVASAYQGNDLQILDLDNIRYYLLPCRVSSSYQKHLEPLWQKVCTEFSPDVVHIHGTEYLHGLACMRACQNLNYVVSIQGLVSIYARYYYAGLTQGDIFKNVTFRDVVRLDTIFHGKRTFDKRGVFEEEYIKRTKHVIGRTGWDFAHSKAINHEVTYHHCNEMLRDGFYSAEKWDIRKKTDHSLFLSQAAYPIKGLHQALKAVALLIKDFPDIKVRIAGHSIINKNTLVNRLKISGYGSYILKLVKRLGLVGRVEFTGPLSEGKMIAEYLNAHLFICPSSIENSPNSVGEAQILGVPTIASFVGGIPDMLSHRDTGLLYRFEEVEMLAENIRQVFTDDHLARRLSAQGIVAAEQRHNQTVNCDQTNNIYTHIAA
jgi:glycosyltransferase involved in cell wall biosynthesis